MSLNNFPGGDPENLMYGDGMKPIGFTKDGYDLMRPSQYTDEEKRLLAEIVKTRGGIEQYSEKNRAYLRSVLGNLLS